MKGSTILATMQRLGVMPSFSRPSVSHDNPCSESLFRTVKYCPLYPTKPFASLEEARAWVTTFVPWYNEEQLHSGIRFTAPASRHAGMDSAILAQRARVYHAAQHTHPSRWSGATRNWTKIAHVTLNGVKNGVEAATTEPRRTANGRSRDPEREWFPQAEGQRIETGRAHFDPTPGSDVTPIVDPRATVREETFDGRLKNSNGRTGESLDDRNRTHDQAIEPHDEGVLNKATWSVSRANRRLMS